MNITKLPLVTITVRNGLVTGVLAVTLLVAIFYIGQHPLMISPYFDYRIFLFGVFIFFSLKEIRDDHQNGVLYFWQAMMGSCLVVFVATLVGSIGLLLFTSLEPRFVPGYIEGMTAYLKTFSTENIEQIGKEVYERNLVELPSTNGMDLMITYFVQGIIIGFFVSIIISAILRKQPKPI